ncbi:hypothetical protein CMT47_19545 [Elizabethkingia anophelis]|nr:hypothetical protein [Elizabethkingia anophelis]MDV4088320.1 hypothetical protein [Elizabethkingia anophelis]
MPQFLNKDLILEWLPKLIATSERELIIISPYIQVSKEILKLLKEAEERGVEITLIYKEGELNEKERIKLNEIENLNLLYHQHLHSKCLYNEKFLLITSMNLYEFSQKHNRELGILFRRQNDSSHFSHDSKLSKDPDHIFQDAIEEIHSIVTSSTFEKESFDTKSIGFNIDIIKSNKVLAQENCDLFNKYSKNKKFTIFQHGEEWLYRCNNFIDNVDVIIEKHRVLLNMNFEQNRLEEMFKNLQTNNYGKQGSYRIINCFRLFWTYPTSAPTLYPYANHTLWDYDSKSRDFFEGYLFGLNEFFKILKTEIIKTKK